MTEQAARAALRLALHDADKRAERGGGIVLIDRAVARALLGEQETVERPLGVPSDQDDVDAIHEVADEDGEFPEFLHDENQVM